VWWKDNQLWRKGWLNRVRAGGRDDGHRSGDRVGRRAGGVRRGGRGVPGGEAKATIELDADALLARHEQLQQAVLASAVPSRRVLPETERPVREVRQPLFEAAGKW
jgi:hypothetical protein